MQFVIKVTTENATFADRDMTKIELARILKGITQNVEEFDRLQGLLYDSNYNKVGSYGMTR